MGSEWKEGKLGDYVDSCLGKMLDKNKNKGDFHPYLGNSNVRWGSFDLDDLAQMKFEPSEHSRYGIKAGDLIVCEGGEPGRCAIWEEDIPNMKIQKALHRIRTLKELDSEYLFYWFLYAGRTGLLEAYFTGTTIKHLTGKALKELPIRIPSIERQKQVAQLMRGFDKKIKLNRQINQTLEQMAQTLFKSWFVDFDPVIDNALDAIANGQNIEIPESLAKRFEARKAVREREGFEPLPTDIRQLFPCEFEESELSVGICGFVPKGWHLGYLSDVSKVLSGFAFKGKDFSDSGDAVIKIKNINSDRTVGIHDVQRVPSNIAKLNEKFLLKDGSLIMAMTGATVGKFGLLVTENNEQYFLNQRVAKFENSDEGCGFIYCALNQKVSEDYIVNAAQGSAQPNISAKGILDLPLIVPNKGVRLYFNNQVNDFFDKIIINRKQIFSLTKLRDTLLPKLISGELRLDSPQGEALQQAVSAE